MRSVSSEGMRNEARRFKRPQQWERCRLRLFGVISDADMSGPRGLGAGEGIHRKMGHGGQANRKKRHIPRDGASFFSVLTLRSREMDDRVIDGSRVLGRYVPIDPEEFTFWKHDAERFHYEVSVAQ